MKLRILVTPLMIAAIIYLAIWVAIPTYSGSDGVVAVGEKQKQAADKLSDITVKEENAGNLVTILDNNTEQQKILAQYLPEKRMDEDVIASVNSLASDSGVFLASIALKDEAVIAAPVPEPIIDGNGNVVPSEPVMPKATAKNFVADVALSGDYEKMWQFIVNLSNLKRFNEISAMEIATPPGASNGLLLMKISIKFNYLDRLGLIENMSNEVFATGKFNMNAIDKIKSKTSVDVSKVSVESSGRVNPFSE